MLVSNVKTVLQGLAEVAAEIGVLGQLRVEHDRVSAEYDARIAKVSADKETALVNIKSSVRETEARIIGYVCAHIEDFRTQDAKSKRFETGTIKTKEELNIKYPKEDELMEAIRVYMQDPTRFIQTKEVPNKAALRTVLGDDPDLAEKMGVEVSQDIRVTIETL